MPEARDDMLYIADRVNAGRAFLRDHRPEDALREFEAAYDLAIAALTRVSLDVDSTALHEFVSSSYWRSAAFNQLRMWLQAEEQTYELVKLAIDEQAGLTSAEYGLIYYARGRCYLEAGGLYDAIVCFESALRWDSTLLRASRDRIRAYRTTDGSAALYYAMQAVRDMPNSFDLRAELTAALLDARLWGQAEAEASDLAARFPRQEPVALVLLARAIAGQERIDEALDYCRRAVELDNQNQGALELMAGLLNPAASSDTQEASVDPAGRPVLEPELRLFDPVGTNRAQRNDNPAESPVPERELSEGAGRAQYNYAPPEFSGYERESSEEASNAQHIEAWLAEASACQDSQNYDRALELFQLVLETSPDNMEAICGQLNCLRLTHMFSQAKTKAEDTIERHRADWRLYVAFGRILHSQGEYAKALDWYDKAEGEKPGNIEVGIARSVTLCAQGNAGAAGDLIDDLLMENQGNFLLLEEQAWVAFFRRNYGDAEYGFRELYEKSYAAFLLKSTPERVAEMAKTSYGRGYVAMKQGDHFAALTNFLEAKNRAQGVADYRLAHAWSQVQTGDKEYLEKAKETCRELVRATSSPLAHNCLGVIYFKLGFPNDSETHFKAAAQVGSAYASHVDLGAVYASWAETERAEKEFRKAIELNPRDADAHYELGALLLSAQDKDDLRAAESEFRKAKANDPDSIRAVVGLSRCFRLQGRMTDAEQELRRGIERFTRGRDSATRSDQWRLHVELAVLLIDRGDATRDERLYGKAYGEARAAIELARTSWEPHYVAAVASERSRHFRAAGSHLRNCGDCGGDQASIESLRTELETSRVEARVQATAPWLCGVIAFIMLVFIVLALGKIDQQSTAVLLALISVFVGMSLMVLFGDRLVKFSLGKIVTAELSALSEQPLPVGPTGQFPAAGDRFDLPPRPFGQQPRRA